MNDVPPLPPPPDRTKLPPDQTNPPPGVVGGQRSPEAVRARDAYLQSPAVAREVSPDNAWAKLPVENRTSAVPGDFAAVMKQKLEAAGIHSVPRLEQAPPVRAVEPERRAVETTGPVGPVAERPQTDQEQLREYRWARDELASPNSELARLGVTPEKLDAAFHDVLARDQVARERVRTAEATGMTWDVDRQGRAEQRLRAGYEVAGAMAGSALGSAAGLIRMTRTDDIHEIGRAVDAGAVVGHVMAAVAALSDRPVAPSTRDLAPPAVEMPVKVDRVPGHAAEVEAAMRANPANTIGAGGEASALATCRTTGPATDLNTLRPSAPTVDLSHPGGFASVKTFGVGEKPEADRSLSAGTTAQYDRALRDQISRPMPGTTPVAAEKAARFLAEFRDRLVEVGTWPTALAQDAPVAQIADHLARESLILVPSDHVAPLREYVAAEAHRNPAVYEVTTGPDQAAQIAHLVSRIQSSGMTSAEYKAINDRVHAR